MNAQDPELLIEIRIGSSGDLLQSYDRRELDTVIARLHAGRDDGTVLAEEQLAGSRRRTGSIARTSRCRCHARRTLRARAGGQAAGRVGGAVARGLRRRRRGGSGGGRHGRAGRGRAGAPHAAVRRRRRRLPDCGCPRCRACRCCCTRAPGAAAPAGARRAVGGVPGRDTRLCAVPQIRPHAGRAPFPLTPQSWRRPGLHSRFRRNTPQGSSMSTATLKTRLSDSVRRPCAPRHPNA